MNSQHHKTAPKGYAFFHEEDSVLPPSAPPASHQQQHAISIPKEAPVLIQGVPVLSLPAHHRVEPMRSFEISQPNSTELRKLDSWWFSLYKAYLILGIIFESNVFFVGLSGEQEVKFHSAVPGILFFHYLLSGWMFFINIRTFSAIRRKSLKKIRRAIDHMRFYAIAFGIFWMVVDAEQNLYPDLTSERCQIDPGSCKAFAIFLFFWRNGLVWGLFFGLVMFPAIKFRNILIKAEGTIMRM